jgi:hypothetical protein
VASPRLADLDSRIDGAFDGWGADRAMPLADGQVWR